MPEIALSYVLTTYNKIDFIKIVLSDLIGNKKEDEEIIVIDGCSTDGTVEYLKDLRDSSKIDYFLSEKDIGEAHGFNKGVLLAKGILIKIISDDDAFYYPAFSICKQYMLEHPEIDILASNTAVTYANNYRRIEVIKDYQEGFMKWKEGRIKNFAFCMTPVLIRRSSLPLTGLFYVKSKIPDFEWTIRVSGFANIAWYTGFPVVNIINNLSSSASSTNVFKVWPEEWSRFVHFYDWVPPKKIMRNYPLLPVSLKIKLTRFNLKNYYKTNKRRIKVCIYLVCVRIGLIKKKDLIESKEELNFEKIYQFSKNWLTDKNQEAEFVILKK